MKKNYFLLLLVLCLAAGTTAQGPFAPAAGEPGTTAIHKDSVLFQSWATGIEVQRGFINIADTSVYHSGSNLATFGHPSLALGQAAGTSIHAVSLGDAGVATLTFDRPIFNGPGPDFAIFENSFSDTYLELAFVEVSSDGERFVRFPAISLTPESPQVGGFGNLDPTNLYNFAGKYRQGFGTPFDLDDLKDSTGIDLNSIRFIRVIDVVGCVDCDHATYDSQGNVVNDPWPSPFDSGGFDLEAVGLINTGDAFLVADFSEHELEEDSVWLPGESTWIVSGPFSMYHEYDAEFSFWSGFTLSAKNTITGDNFVDQYTAKPQAGMQGEGSAYVVGYIQSDWLSGTFDPIPNEIIIEEGAENVVSGLYVTNNAWTYDVILNGEAWTQAFGGPSGNEPDWFRIAIWGENLNGHPTDTVHFYLADYRFEDNSLNYVVDDWQWVDLASLGAVTRLFVILESSDTGDFGMNTPGYFCLDNITLLTPQTARTAMHLADIEVEENAEPLSFDISGVFVVPMYGKVQAQVSGNTQPDLVQTHVDGDALTLTFTPGMTGNAVITLSDSENEASVEFTVTVLPFTHAHQLAEFASRVYPNPFSDAFFVEAPAGSHISVFNTMGQQVISERVSNGSATMITGLVKGYYLVRIVHGTRTETFRVISSR